MKFHRDTQHGYLIMVRTMIVWKKKQQKKKKTNKKTTTKKKTKKKKTQTIKHRAYPKRDNS